MSDDKNGLEELSDTIDTINSGTIKTVKEIVEEVKNISEKVTADLKMNVFLVYLTFVLVFVVLCFTLAIIIALASVLGYYIFLLLT